MRHPIIVAVVCAIVAADPNAHGTVAAAQADTSSPRAVLDRYCVTCHNQRLKSGGLALDALDLTRPSDHAAVAERIVRKLRTGAMPPA